MTKTTLQDLLTTSATLREIEDERLLDSERDTCLALALRIVQCGSGPELRRRKMNDYVIRWDVVGEPLPQGPDPVSPTPIRAATLDEAFAEAEELVREFLAHEEFQSDQDFGPLEICLTHQDQDGLPTEFYFDYQGE